MFSSYNTPKQPSKSGLVKGIALILLGIALTAFVVGFVIAAFGIYYLAKYFRQKGEYQKMARNIPPPLKKPWRKRLGI